MISIAQGLFMAEQEFLSELRHYNGIISIYDFNRLLNKYQISEKQCEDLLTQYREEIYVTL